MASVETAFSPLNVKSGLTRNTSAQNDSASNSKNVDENIKEGVALIIEREVDGIFFFFEYGHYASKFPKRQNKYKRRFWSRRPRNCLYVNEEEEEDESDQSRSEDELGFVAIKEDDLDRQIREESALIS